MARTLGCRRQAYLPSRDYSEGRRPPCLAGGAYVGAVSLRGLSRLLEHVSVRTSDAVKAEDAVVRTGGCSWSDP